MLYIWKGHSLIFLLLQFTKNPKCPEYSSKVSRIMDPIILVFISSVFKLKKFLCNWSHFSYHNWQNLIFCLIFSNKKNIFLVVHTDSFISIICLINYGLLDCTSSLHMKLLVISIDGAENAPLLLWLCRSY